MYYFFGIISDDDLLQGRQLPSYVLRKTQGTTGKRSGFFVVRENATHYKSQPKVQVSSQTGNDFFIDIMTNYRTRDHNFHDKKYTAEERAKYFPSGAQCCFECDKYGIQTGPAVFIKHVPDHSAWSSDSGMRLKKLYQDRVYALPEIFSQTESFY